MSHLHSQGHDFKIAHIKSSGKISDYSSRHPFTHPWEKKQYLKKYLSFVCRIHSKGFDFRRYYPSAEKQQSTSKVKIFDFQKQMVLNSKRAY